MTEIFLLVSNKNKLAPIKQFLKMTSRYESKLQIKNRLQGLKLLVKESEILLILPMLITSEKMVINLTGWNTF